MSRKKRQTSGVRQRQNTDTYVQATAGPDAESTLLGDRGGLRVRPIVHGAAYSVRGRAQLGGKGQQGERAPSRLHRPLWPSAAPHVRGVAPRGAVLFSSELCLPPSSLLRPSPAASELVNRRVAGSVEGPTHTPPKGVRRATGGRGGASSSPPTPPLMLVVVSGAAQHSPSRACPPPPRPQRLAQSLLLLLHFPQSIIGSWPWACTACCGMPIGVARETDPIETDPISDPGPPVRSTG